MRPVAITATYDEVNQYYFSLDGKIQRDKDGIEMFEINHIEGTDLATLVYVPVPVKKMKQPKLQELRNKLQTIQEEMFQLKEIDDLIKENEQIILYDRKRNVVFSGTALTVSRWMTRTAKKRQIEEAIKRVAEYQY